MGLRGFLTQLSCGSTVTENFCPAAIFATIPRTSSSTAAALVEGEKRTSTVSTHSSGIRQRRSPP